MRFLLAAALAGAAFCALARDDGRYANSDPGRKQWFRELTRSPNDKRGLGFDSCCDAGDVYPTKFKVEKTTAADEWYYLKDGNWKRVPAEIILWDKRSIDGKPYLFIWAYDGATELCFVPPDGGS